MSPLDAGAATMGRMAATDVAGDDAESALDGARSLTTAVYRRLRQEIATSRLVQNEKLHLARLQERFGVSLSVVREALSRLVADGLVVAEAQRGFRVSPISKRDLVDVTRTRIRVEGMALRLAIANGDAAWTDALIASHAAMNAAERTTQTPVWAARHADFHRRLLAPCDSAWTLRFRDLLFEQSERYRYLFARLEDSNKLPVKRDVDQEHRDLLDAVVARDADRAVAALEAHFEHTMNAVLAVTSID